MANWIEICNAETLNSGERVCAQAGNESVVAFNLDGELHAIRNVCPHAGLPLNEGDLEGVVLTCPYHGYAFDVTNGENVDFPDDEAVTRFPIKQEEGKIMVDVDAQA